MRPAGSKGARAERTRAAVLESAEQLFAAYGFAGTRLTDVAESVGIRRASLVYYFPSKAALYDAVLESVFSSLLRRYERALSQGGSAAERIERIFSTWVDYVSERPSLLRIVLRETAEGLNSPRHIIDRHVQPVVAEIRAIIEEGQRDEGFRDLGAQQVLAMLGGATIFYFLGGPGVEPTSATSANVELHRRELLRMTRTLLGIRTPRLVRKRSKHV